MSHITDNAKLDACGCCEAGAEEPGHENRPGQSALTYRIGTHSSFLRRMLDRLSKEKIPDGENQGTRPLSALTTRSTNDPAVALLDTWAMVADVLTFYQERIVNEGYLKTATERRSVLELARAIGYELSPGVAASTYLAFTVEDAEGAPDKATIPEGAQVQSVPAEQGELPQTFETVEGFEAHAEWNELRPRLTWPQRLTEQGGIISLEDTSTNLTHLYIKGTTTDLKAGNLLLLVHDEEAATVTEVKQILNVKTNHDEDWTRVDFEKELEAPAFQEDEKPEGTAGLEQVEFTEDNIEQYVLDQKWTEDNLNLFLTMNGWEADELLTFIGSYLSGDEESDSEGVFAFRQRVGFFGHNAPRQEALPLTTYTRGDPYSYPWDGDDARTIWTDSQGIPYNQTGEEDSPHVYLERSLSELVGDRWAVFSGFDASGFMIQKSSRIVEVTEVSLVDYALSAKVAGLKLIKPNELSLGMDDQRPGFLVRKTTAYVQSEKLELADQIIETPLIAGATDLELDGMVLGLQEGQALALTGERDDTVGVYRSEIVILDKITHSVGYTTLFFTGGLQYSYVRDTVTLNANVVKATHGEMVQEVLGSGDGSQTNQRFALKKTPLTYVSAPTASGGQSTLEVRVNNVLWQEASSLYGLDATSESYTVRIDNEGIAKMTFGDGKSGARLPSGQENVVATYRTGTGKGGEVDSESLTLLKTRPLGIKAVNNPLAASGAADLETLDEAQVHAPRTVLTLDRIVSLQDVEDFARTFSGIGKAQAVDLTKGETQLVHLSITGADGDTVDKTSELYVSLSEAIDQARNLSYEIRIDSFQPVYFDVSAKVLVNSRYIVGDVLLDVEAALKEAFAFAQRDLGQTVSAAEIISVIYQVSGVEAVDLDALNTVDDSGTLASVLPAEIAHWDGDDIRPAELLLINETGITLEEMTTT